MLIGVQAKLGVNLHGRVQVNSQCIMYHNVQVRISFFMIWKSVNYTLSL